MSISIIIPNHNGCQLLQKNLPTVLKAGRVWDKSKRHWEVIVVDDASQDESVKWLTEHHPQIKVVQNPHNLRFAQTVNRGVKEAQGDIVVLLNNDVVPAPNFLSPLLDHFRDESVFAVGCLEKNSPDGRLIGGRGVGEFKRGFLIHARAQDQTKITTLWVAAGSGAFRKSIWEKLGGLDPLFRPAYEEDRDLCYTALKAGYRIIFEPKSQVSHIHETSNIKAFGKGLIQVMSFKNQLLFVWKNISSPNLLLNHFLWLPYHLSITTIKTKGLFLLGFLWAISQLSEVTMSRSRAQKVWQLNDEQILHQFEA